MSGMDQITGQARQAAALAASPAKKVHGLKSGETADLGGVQVRYDSRPSHGDNGQVVRGATVGEYTVTYPNGQSTSHAHGPHANTDTAAKRGANPNAKGYAARQALEAVARHQATQRTTFNDRRPTGGGEDHPARLDDDSPQSKARCKDCGKRITWNGPNHSDWAHV